MTMLQRLSRFLVQCVTSCGRNYPVAIGGEANIARTRQSVATDPQRTSQQFSIALQQTLGCFIRSLGAGLAECSPRAGVAYLYTAGGGAVLAVPLLSMLLSS
jgi:hypothetical protein